eukprot:4433851-Pleurochrysis_carterae.AAC.1
MFAVKTARFLRFLLRLACKSSAAICFICCFVVVSSIHSVSDTKPRSTHRADAQRLVAPRP